MVPAMVFVFGMNQHDAQGTSLFAIIPTAVAGSIIYSMQQNINVHAALWLAIGGMLGGYAGSMLAGKISQKQLKIVYATFILFVGVKMWF